MKLSETKLIVHIKQTLDILKYGEVVNEKMFSPINKHLRDIESKLSNTVRNINKSITNPQEHELKTELSAVIEENSCRLNNMKPPISR